MTIDPYQSNMAAKIKFTHKRMVRAHFVVILQGMIENRGIELIPPGSRCVRRGEIFELICTAEETAKPGGRVDQATYLGFCEVSQSGVIRVGDRVEIEDHFLGNVAGFDETHAPNHLNVVIGVSPNKIPPPQKYQLESEITFELATE